MVFGGTNTVLRHGPHGLGMIIRSDIRIQLPSVHDARGTVGGTGTARKVRATGDAYVSCLLHFLKQPD